jgi:hypothetical protein
MLWREAAAATQGTACSPATIHPSPPLPRAPASMAVTAPAASLCSVRMMQLPQPIRVTSSPSFSTCRQGGRQAGRRAGRQRQRQDQQVSATALGVEVSVGLPSHGMSPACSRPAPSQQPHNRSHNHGLGHPPERLPGPATGCCCASAAWCPRAGTWHAAAAPQIRESRGRCSAAQAPCTSKGGRGTAGRRGSSGQKSCAAGSGTPGRGTKHTWCHPS